MSTPKRDVTRKGLSPAGRRVLVFAGALLGAFLLGLLPMWLVARERGRQLDETRRELRRSRMQNQLGEAALGARRGDYEPARRAASVFFSNVRAEVDRGTDSALTPAQQQGVAPLLAERDEMITLLARSDPASADRLSEMFAAYLKALGEPER